MSLTTPAAQVNGSFGDTGIQASLEENGMCFDCDRETTDRRSFLTGVAATTVGLAAGEAASAGGSDPQATGKPQAAVEFWTTRQFNTSR